MLSKESHYLTIGCLTFGSVAIPIMLGLFVHNMLRTQPATLDDGATSMKSWRALLPPSLNGSLPIEMHRGEISQRAEIQLCITVAVDEEGPLHNESNNLIEVEIVDPRLNAGLELQLRVTNKTPVTLNLINFELDFFDEDRKYLGAGSASCFFLASGESKVISAVSFDGLADLVHDYDLRLENAIGTDDAPVREIKLHVTTDNRLHYNYVSSFTHAGIAR